jgi:hypothetical protein
VHRYHVHSPERMNKGPERHRLNETILYLRAFVTEQSDENQVTEHHAPYHVRALPAAAACAGSPSISRAPAALRRCPVVAEHEVVTPDRGCLIRASHPGARGVGTDWLISGPCLQASRLDVRRQTTRASCPVQVSHPDARRRGSGSLEAYPGRLSGSSASASVPLSQSSWSGIERPSNVSGVNTASPSSAVSMMYLPSRRISRSSV